MIVVSLIVVDSKNVFDCKAIKLCELILPITQDSQLVICCSIMQ